jgi:hypothetical protein
MLPCKTLSTYDMTKITSNKHTYLHKHTDDSIPSKPPQKKKSLVSPLVARGIIKKEMKIVNDTTRRVTLI